MSEPTDIDALIAELRGFAEGSESARATLMRDAADALESVHSELRQEQTMTNETIRELSKRLAGEDREHMRSLIAERRDRGLTQADIANRLGVPTAWAHEFEAYDSDPRLSELRRYETAVKARGGWTDDE